MNVRETISRVSTPKVVWKNYFSNTNRRRQSRLLKNSATHSIEDLGITLKQFFKRPTPLQLIGLTRTFTTSGLWISRSYLKFLSSLVDFSSDASFDRNENEEEILKKVSEGKPIPKTTANTNEIFKVIYNELEYSHHNPEHKSILTCPPIKPTVVLISGVFNEIFSTPAFERGAKHLKKINGLKYITPQTSGIKGSKENAESLARQLEAYIAENPREKLWLISFSKGGVDSLHFLNQYKDFAEKYIIGLSTIASPILGTNHLNNRGIKLLNSVHKLSQTKVYQFIDKRKDILAKELQKSLSSRYQENWFKRNHKKLPKDIFYTAVALEAEWYESHLWMVLTKVLFQSENINDGVVDADRAFFPSYFKGHNLGILKGHHLVGTRSSFYSQEALLEAHIVYLNYLKLLK